MSMNDQIIEAVGAMVKYFDVEANWWDKIDPHTEDPELTAVLAHDLSLFFGKPFDPEDFPSEQDDSYDLNEHQYACDLAEYGPMFWLYTVTHACHWLVNFNLMLAQRAEPQRPWRIITSDYHSTVWDGDQTLFEFNDMRWGTAPDECFKKAYSKELPVGQLMETMPTREWESVNG